MIDREPRVPDERRIRFRIGVNLGVKACCSIIRPRIARGERQSRRIQCMR
jgi:hypothetical protein